jgi:general secretion pathway protein I
VRVQGFTYIEIMVALAIIAGLLVTVISVMNYHIGLVERQRTATIATLVAKEKLTALKKTKMADRGLLSAPLEGFNFESSIKDSPYPSIYEVSVMITNNREEFVLSELVQK